MSFRYSSDIITPADTKLININSCGELCLTSDSHILRPQGRKDYQLIYINEGCCYITVKGERSVVFAGDCIIYRPGEVQDYMFLKSDNPKIYWIHFSGAVCAELFNKLSLNDITVIRTSNSHAIEYLTASLCKYFNLKTENYPIICSGLLNAALALISNSIHRNRREIGSADKNAAMISGLISRFKMTPNLKISVKDCAKMCKLSQSRFTHIFKEITGSSPQQYIIKTKIDRAKELMAFTDKNISEIAEAVGFTDQNYFSRIFKKSVGVTPTQYRRAK